MPLPIVFIDTNALYAGEDGQSLVSPKGIADIKECMAFGPCAYFVAEITYLELVEQAFKRAVETRDKAERALRKLNNFFVYSFAPMPSEEELRETITNATKERIRSAGLEILQTPYGTIEWAALMNNALRRLPPFERDGTDKGIKDAMILETLKSICLKMDDAPIYLVCSDKLLVEASKEALAARELTIFEKLPDLHAFLKLRHEDKTSAFIYKIVEEAPVTFYRQGDLSCLFIKENIASVLQDKFAKEFAVAKNDTFRLGAVDEYLSLMNKPVVEWRLITGQMFTVGGTGFETINPNGAYVWNTEVRVYQLAVKGDEDALISNKSFKEMTFGIKWSALINDEGGFSDAKVESVSHTKTRFGRIPFSAYYHPDAEFGAVPNSNILEKVAETSDMFLWPKAKSPIGFWPDSPKTVVREVR